MKEYNTRIPLIRCDSSGPLYPVTKSKSQVHIATSPSIWHQCLGHPSDQTLKILLSCNLISCNKVKSYMLCHSCQLRKHTRLPFSLSTSYLSAPFDIIHSDLWTSPDKSLSGIKYYVIFLDHFTHYLWVYPLRYKSEVFEKLIHLLPIIKNQFNQTIKTFQCDNGGEYDNHSFRDFFSQHGIHFRFSCTYTAQQNGKS